MTSAHLPRSLLRPFLPLFLRPLLRHAAAAALLACAHGAASAADITVSAAASLTNAFRDIAQAYEKQYPDARVALNFAASGPLLQQLAKGAPVDVFASADQPTMDKAQQLGLVRAADRHNFTRNALVVIVPADSRAVLRQVNDLAAPAIARIAIGNPASVPAGRYAQDDLSSAGAQPSAQIQPKLVQALSVRQALDYVARGEVDAGYVYATDAAIMAGKVKVAYTAPTRQPILYPIALTASSAQPAEARRFIAFVRSPAAEAILGKYGFLKP